MTMNAKRRRAHQKLAALPGVRSVRRPVRDGSDEEFDLYYVRSGRKTRRPLVVIPGGPGAASVGLYRGFRRRAAAAGLDVVMIEHRGVGMSRHDDAGNDLPPDALTIERVVDDVVAVLDDAQVEAAILYGTSYGTYIAAGVGVVHPHRVHAMILDSPLLSNRDIEDVRGAIRETLWDGNRLETAQLAPKMRRLVGDGLLAPSAGQLAAVMYGLGGAELLNRQLDLLLDGRRWLWTGLNHFARLLFSRKAPYRNEADLVGRIGYRELNYGGVPDGKPLDPAVAFREFFGGAGDFEAEPYDLVAEMPKFSWPSVVVSGSRDLTTPTSVAKNIAALVPDAVLVRLATAGHSALDSRERAALEIAKAVRDGHTQQLAGRAAQLDALPGPRLVRLFIGAIRAAAAVEGALPSAVPRVVARVTTS
ncbi:MAG TPA: alpha/beta fold hydrolase [Mycobacterium sp.]|nr:alpha/beta fold hydrolase [Mycobacterium sp.]